MALRGALAASITPLRDLGSEPDDDAFGPLCDFYVESGLDGVLALGTAGEGILLRVDERRHVADLFLQAADNRLQVAVHCGAQTTRDTVTLAAHAAEVGADAVVVIGPPYFKLDEQAQYAHFFAAAAACAPLPVLRLRVRRDDRVPDRSGRPRAPARRGRQRRRPQGLRHALRRVREVPASGVRHLRRARGAHRGRDGPRARSARCPRSPPRSRARSVPSSAIRARQGAARLGELRAFVERFPRQAALKRLLALQGVPVREDVRAPLRSLTVDERDELDAWAGSVLDYAESNSS